MNRPLSNPFSEAYVTHTVTDENFVRFFSPELVTSAIPIFQPGNVVVRGTQGSGKSMLLRLLDPAIKAAYHKVRTLDGMKEVRYPIPEGLDTFVSARVDLNRSGLLDITNTLSEEPSTAEITDLVRSFADLFNFWALRDLLECVKIVSTDSNSADGVIAQSILDAFAEKLAQHECWHGSLDTVGDWQALLQTVKERVVTYRSWANGNRILPPSLVASRTVIGEPLSHCAEMLKSAEILKNETGIFITIDQLEALWMQGEGRRSLGERLRREIHQLLGKRDERASYRIGVRRYDWGKGGSLAMRDGRELEEGRDYHLIDIDEILRRKEYAKGWVFKKFARDVFERRVRATLRTTSTDTTNLEKSDRFFGSSPTPQEVVFAAIKRPDPTGDKLLRLDEEWPAPWRKTILRCYRREITGIPQPPPDACSVDPLNALLLSAWGLQTGGRGKGAVRERRFSDQPPQSADEAPWNKAKMYWRKERYPQAVLQLLSRHQQRMLWWGEAKVFSLSGSNILRFITICRETWDHWQRLSDDLSETAASNETTRIVSFDIQYRAIGEASRKIYEALKRQPGQPGGDVRIRFLDQIASWLRGKLLDDVAMSNPGQNGFSLRVSDLHRHPDLRQLIEEAVGWGDLYEMDHTSKEKSERSSEPRKKYYLNPALSPFYELPEAHTKEPVYADLKTILRLAVGARAIRSERLAEGKHDSDENQLTLFSDKP